MDVLESLKRASSISGNNVAGGIIAVLSRDSLEKAFLRDDEMSLNRRQFLARVGVRQQTFHNHGIREGTRALVSTGRGAQFWIDLVALWGLGAIAIPFDHAMREDFALDLMERAAPQVLIGTPGDGRENTKALPRIGHDPVDAPASDLIVPIDGTDSTADRTAIILFTSGSTGRPKGVELSHHSLMGNALSTLSVLHPADDDRLLVSTPYHFVSSLSHFLVAALAGILLVALERKMIKADLYKALEERRPTCFGGSPLQLRWIAECAAERPIELRWAISSGDYLPVDVIKAVRANLPGIRIFTIYGLTELGGRCCILCPDELDGRVDSVGQSIPGLTVSVRDERMRPAGVNQTGEIVVRGEYLFKGYFRDPEATKEATTEDGMRTGDLGYLDADGFLYIVGRTDDVFKVSGHKVSVVVIADALMGTGLFADVAVRPVDHPVYGTVAHAYYVLKAGKAFDKGDVLRHLRRQLPSTHLPHGFTEMDEIPRTGSGKVRRKELGTATGSD